MLKNKTFTYWILSLPIIAIILTSTLLTYEFISYEQEEFKKESIKLEEEFISKIKQRIKNRINRVTNLIESNIELIREEEKKNIKTIIDIGYKTIEETYEKNSHLENDQIIQIIKSRLENLKFYSNGSGYFFIIDLNDKVLMQPQTPEHTNKVFTNLQDKHGKYFIQSFRNIAKTKGEGFDTWYWTKPKTNKIGKKIGYIKAFKPLNLYIGTAKYEDDINTKIEKESLKIIDIIKYGKDEYVFAINSQGTTLSHINKKFIGKKIKTLSEVEQNIINNILNKASQKGGGFIGYTPTSHNVSKRLSSKISYVNIIPTLNWIIGTGQYTTKLNKQIEEKKKELEEELKQATNKIIAISTIITIILILFLSYISRKLQNKLTSYEDELSLKNKHLKELNESLEQKVHDQVLKMKQKEDILNQQSKFAAMGEMIGNIAHQWRQPLSAISTAASGIKMQDEMDILKKQDMYQGLDIIVQNTQVLSDTIDDFRDFFKKDKTKTTFKIESVINKALQLIHSNLKSNDIIVKKDISNIEIFGLKNELTQAILNIINNAKDSVCSSNKGEKYIFIEATQNDNNIVITIKDNGLGIQKDVISNIFDPYFTTKFKSQGTGIGLYMTKTIIVNHMHGEINARNENFTYENKEYFGAAFEIILNKKS